MTIIVSVKINDGVVLAADSAATFFSGQVYVHAEKIVNLVKGLPVGVMVTGHGGIGSESITTILKDLRRRLSGRDHIWREWTVDPDDYDIESIAHRLATLLREKDLSHTSMHLRVAGYSSDRPLPEIWDLVAIDGVLGAPSLLRGEDQWGVNWEGQREALDRLILGIPAGVDEALEKGGCDRTLALQYIRGAVGSGHLYNHVVLPAMPIQDAVDLARYLVETTIGFVRYSIMDGFRLA